MGGRFALKKFLGVNNKGEVEAILRNIDGIKPEEVKAFNVLVDTVAGYREVVSYKDGWEKGLHSLSTVTSMLHTMNFGISAATEITTVVANTGFKNTVKTLIPGFKKTMEIYKRGGNEADFRQLTVLQDVGAHKFGNEVNRFELGENFDKYGALQDTMNNVVHKEAQYSGLLMFTDWFKVSAQMASQNFIAESAKNIAKISKADRKRLNQIGLSDQHLTELNKHMYKDGKFTGLNRDKWSDELNEVVDRGSMTQAYNSILHPDGFTLPQIMTEGSSALTRTLNNSVLKFMKFPVASYEALLLQGISTLDAKVIVGTSLNMAMWSQIILAKDRLNTWGDDSKLKYDLDSDEGWYKLMIDSVQVMSVTGSLAAGGNMGSALLTGESMQGYSKSVGDSVVLSDMQRTMRGDVPMSLYGVQLMKTLENLDLVHATFTPKVGFQRGYGLGED